MRFFSYFILPISYLRNIHRQRSRPIAHQAVVALGANLEHIDIAAFEIGECKFARVVVVAILPFGIGDFFMANGVVDGIGY
jgi:hypothetical protein